MALDFNGSSEGLAQFARAFGAGLQRLQSPSSRPPVVEQIIGMDERGRLRRQMLLHESPVVTADLASVHVLVPGPGVFEVRGALFEWAGTRHYVGRAFVYVCPRGSRLFDSAEVEAVARTLDTPRRPGRPREWLRRRAVAAEGALVEVTDRSPQSQPLAAGDVPGPVFGSLGVGDVVYLRNQRWGQVAGARAVCYEAFELAELPGRAFVFADGLTVGCDAREFDRHFGFVRHESGLALMRLRDPRELALAVAQGKLASAFEDGVEERAVT